MGNESTITVQFSRKECEFLKAIINAVVDDSVDANSERDFMVLDMCSHLHKLIDDAEKR